MKNPKADSVLLVRDKILLLCFQVLRKGPGGVGPLRTSAGTLPILNGCSDGMKKSREHRGASKNSIKNKVLLNLVL